MSRPSKYGAIPRFVEGIRFASSKEAFRYGELRLLEKAGVIKELELQPKFPLMVPDASRIGRLVTIGHYIADFRYREGPSGILRIEDVKGVRTAMYKLKKKMVEAIYGVRITEV